MLNKKINIASRTSRLFRCQSSIVINDKVFVKGVEKYLIDHNYLKKEEMQILGLPFLVLRATAFLQMTLDLEEKRGGKHGFIS